jgi:hypothetical protein
LSWSEKPLPATPPGLVTLVTPVTLSKDPTASDMWLPVAWVAPHKLAETTHAETSMPLPI